MTESFDFDSPDHFTAGAIGPPGTRVFYLQARENGAVISLRLEKQQVAALCEYLGGILADLPPTEDASPTFVSLIEPVVAEWVVGTLAVAYEEAADRILLVAEELTIPDNDGTKTDDADDRDGDDDVDILGMLGDSAVARFRLTRPQVGAMVRHAREVIASGRPFCKVCGLPIDPDGHLCPRNN